LAVAGFFTNQRLGIFRLLEEALVRLAGHLGWGALANLTKIDDGLNIIHAPQAALAVAFCVHLIVWFIGALVILIPLRSMCYSVGYSEALTIESLGQAARAVGFLIPAGLGVQEGGYAVVCAVLGIPAPVAIALSLVKRVPEIALGLPGLLAWRALEGLERP